MTVLRSYDLNGKKLSFANWISNLSPQDTPFVSMTDKESIDQTLFQWQTDNLAVAGENSVTEGASAAIRILPSTQVLSNVTQILRKVVKVSETANALANYGRGQELQYQMGKAGQELKRDLEWAFLNNSNPVTGSGVQARETAGFKGLVAPRDQAHPETGAVVHKNYIGNVPTESDIFDITYNLYLAGAEADIIMYHPSLSSVFSSLQEKPNTRKRIFENTPKYSVFVSTLVDPLGQEFKLVPNRWMPKDAVYFFNADDWTQMVLRAPSRTKLSKKGSYEKWMLEMEVGLRHKHPFASGILEHHVARVARSILDSTKTVLNGRSLSTGDVVNVALGGVAVLGLTILNSLTRALDESVDLLVYKDDRFFLRKSGVKLGEVANLTLYNQISASDGGAFKVVAQSDSYEDDTLEFVLNVEDPISGGGPEEVLCTVENYIQSITSDSGRDMLDTSVNFQVEIGSSLPKFVAVRVTDDALGGRVNLVKRGTDPSEQPVVSSKAITDKVTFFDFEDAVSSDSGTYTIVVVKDTCVQASEPFTVTVLPKAAVSPIIPGSEKVNGISLSTSEEVQVTIQEGDNLSFEIQLVSSAAGSTIEITSGGYATSIATKINATAGTNTFSLNNVKREFGEQSYCFKVTTPTGESPYFTPFFKLIVEHEPGPKPGEPPLTDELINWKHSYAGSIALHRPNQVVVCQVDQINTDGYFVMLQKDPSKSVEYTLVNVQTGKKIPMSVGPDHDQYKYLRRTAGTWSFMDSGKYKVSAVDGKTSMQESPEFRLQILK